MCTPTTIPPKATRRQPDGLLIELRNITGFTTSYISLVISGSRTNKQISEAHKALVAEQKAIATKLTRKYKRAEKASAK
jgi:hypothetical protein